jgi:hypothetical protein
MNLLITEYKTRKKELLILLKQIRENEKDSRPNELNPILKGALYLFLYNLIESTIRNLLSTTNEKIYQHELVHFDDLNQCLRASIIMNFISRMSKKKEENARKEIDHHCENKKISEIILSNLQESPFLTAIDLKKINKLMESYGIKIEQEQDIEIRNLFQDVQQKRHDLAHGRDSFYEVGKNKTFSDLKKDTRKIVFSLNSVVKKYNDYINAKLYLNEPK